MKVKALLLFCMSQEWWYHCRNLGSRRTWMADCYTLECCCALFAPPFCINNLTHNCHSLIQIRDVRSSTAMLPGDRGNSSKSLGPLNGGFYAFLGGSISSCAGAGNPFAQPEARGPQSPHLHTDDQDAGRLGGIPQLAFLHIPQARRLNQA